MQKLQRGKDSAPLFWPLSDEKYWGSGEEAIS
jgi:hypothetical protein